MEYRGWRPPGYGVGKHSAAAGGRWLHGPTPRGVIGRRLQSRWNTSSMPAHHSSLARPARGCWQATAPLATLKGVFARITGDCWIARQAYLLARKFLDVASAIVRWSPATAQ